MNPPPPTDLQTAISVLETLLADPTGLAALDARTRARLLTAAGQLARPTARARKQIAKAHRRLDREARRAHDAVVLATTANRARKLPSFVLPASTAPSLALDSLAAATPGVPLLAEPRDCYACKGPFRQVHAFYDALCPPCAELNWRKRNQSAPMPGRVAVVTGARIKIGFHVALMLLRAGATVVATTRFPQDAAERYGREPDFEAWRERLHIHGLDLRHVPSVEAFACHLTGVIGRLDVLVNNAAQTVRRPPGFYRHLVARQLLVDETRPLSTLPAHLRPLLASHGALVARVGRGRSYAGIVDSARLSQLALAPGDAEADRYFPDGRFDLDAQQVDLREHNSWRMALDEVPAVELVEVHLVNAIAPCLLTARLRSVMARDRTGDKHVVHVSAMEASFSRKKKTDKHPHTNMAKASLNMMTRTSAKDYAADGIFMNSVDTGWVTDEDPLVHVERKQRVHDFHPPLDAIDGAARVLDPLFDGLLTGRHAYGLFFKDYTPVDW